LASPRAGETTAWYYKVYLAASRLRFGAGAVWPRKCLDREARKKPLEAGKKAIFVRILTLSDFHCQRPAPVLKEIELIY
jgi:hypothetical protein